MLFLVTLFVWVYKRDRRIFAFKWRMLVSSYEAEHYFRTNEGKLTLNEVLLLTLFCLVLSLSVLRYTNDGIIDSLLFFKLAIGIFLVYQFKVFLLKFVGYITGKKFELDFYRYNTDLVYKITGIILLPLLVYFYLSNERLSDIIYFILPFVLILAILVKLIKLIQIFNKYLKFYKIYFFIYFCTLEILPNLVLLTLIFENSNIYG